MDIISTLEYGKVIFFLLLLQIVSLSGQGKLTVTFHFQMRTSVSVWVFSDMQLFSSVPVLFYKTF